MQDMQSYADQHGLVGEVRLVRGKVAGRIQSDSDAVENMRSWINMKCNDDPSAIWEEALAHSFNGFSVN